MLLDCGLVAAGATFGCHMLGKAAKKEANTRKGVRKMRKT